MEDYKEFVSNFSAWLRSSRSRHGMTQKELSILIGVRRASISDWENGKSLPSLYYYDLMANSVFTDSPSFV